ncbi:MULTISPECIES: glycosyltransferase family 4 protein [Rhodococcus]|uniref:Glycosyltransferase family 4 protein n=1 Tax=Rhodococcus oxybenzonivorans TaxID=1990687 RepID=A0AAE4UXY5_9NOCA|nr:MULTISPECIES: glycosyltransferase family 4 protein [Rhodococcus]MDV7246431.1 glycosyltransferase family 4 protein [Rhodococcus oxybenzonivorans]MDV7265110.1 glycosyltransferase family 4 protein [Rhodococcus oxybenzonivorans]MDV7277980.1 glycosyltransferase family 4 protein [Rhodococcus oxybenzonivorans]MDV7337443.1 glycosyltransferase family 4 protein [Rhodococcus oxybenzonivorans]MDV7347548.1 glycosyltransferase family 4 protein [Rhodococcus oxybenzonivorans]
MHEVLLLCWRDTGHPQGGGSERYLEQVGAQLAARGIKVTLRTAGYRGAPKKETVDGIEISRAGGRYSVYPRALAAIAAGRLGFGPLKGIRPDAVIDTQNGIPFFSRTVAGAPVTLLVHHCHREQWPVAGRLVGKIGWWVESRLSPRTHRDNQYLTVSLPSADELVELGVERERIAVVRNGADDIPVGVAVGSAQTRTGHPSVCVLSRLVPHKQIEDALEAVAALRLTIADLHLDVIGGGWWEQNLRDRAHELGIGHAVTFHGHVDESRKHELLSQSWVHVMPSRKEGWGLAVIEAAQHGVPTVGYRSSKGLTDSIVDGVTGVLVGGIDAATADVGDLTAAVSALLLDAETRMVLGEKARVRAGEFSWEQTGNGVHEVLAGTAAGLRTSGLVSPVLPRPEARDRTLRVLQGLEHAGAE